MPVEFGQNSNYAKEMRRWEATHTIFGAPERPYVFHEFPKMLYLASSLEKGGVGITDRISVGDADEQRNMESRGFHVRQEDAIAAFTREQHLIHGTLAAEREWEIQHGRLSDKAVAEVRAHEADHGAHHLPEIPHTPIKKRGRPVKVKEQADAS